mmetsp:Transcript_28933/g.78387  ORF Transcript_28933/g.78387 Transcript_28933/m.78387 type:complete len:511 (+) Transcript_28933:226-1758(+)|eukprot:CAMPEP_0172374148 /NCGR_PEP_ID=MMETSP1060-20121228/54628_1 /TAXON_ID=37318 /ORGANISM="Pseudo-nitzschia pungens, Strain cf. cingulata" /LENGTH=510 /DNA_ID=CAMNT_0013100711 /DNA_START=207 /DNA_END=1739 /DNA_ORIENTATION=-
MSRTCSKTLAALLLLLVALASAIRTPESFPQHSLRQQSSQLRQRKHHAAAAVVESTPRGGKVDAAPASSKPAILDDAVTGTVVLTIIERIVNKFFVDAGIKFPAQLGGCGILFAFLVLADAIAPGKGNAMFEYLTPGTTLLTKWLPVFFVPGLAMLPLAPSVGSGMEVAKVLLVTGLGFVYTLYSVAFTVLFLRKLDGKIVPPAPAQATKKSTPVASGPPAKPFSEEAMSFLFKTSVVTGIGSLLTEKFMTDAVWGTPLKATFFFAATFASYVGCARLPAAFVKAVHPLLTSTFVVWGVLGAYGAATGASFVDSVKTYKTSSLAWNAAGAGDLLLFCLGPSVVSFAVSMYSRKKIMLENFKIVVAAIMVSSLGALFGTAAFTNLIRLGGSSGNALMIRLSMLARNITTALAIPVTQMLGGDIAIAVVVVVLTGIIGAQYGRKLLDLVNIQDPITRGLAVGSAAQGLGVSSMVSEVDAFPFAAMAMALTAVAGTIFVAIPEVKDAVVSFCG